MPKENKTKHVNKDPPAVSQKKAPPPPKKKKKRKNDNNLSSVPLASINQV